MDIRFIDLDSAVNQAKDSAIAVFGSKESPLTGLAATLDQSSGGALDKAIQFNRFQAGLGSVLDIVAPSGDTTDRIILIGTGSEAISEVETAVLGASATAAVLPASHETLVIAIEDDLDPVTIAEGALIRHYRFDKYRTTEAETKKPLLNTLIIACDKPHEAEKKFFDRKGVVEGLNFARDLTSEPANVLYPQSYAERLADLSDIGLKVTILDEDKMADLGMNTLLGVGQGSSRPSRLVALEWHGSTPGEKPVAFVGKGVTFDTGGISIKPSPDMDQMKWDMGGSAIVVGVMKALALRKAKANVVGVVGLVENMPDGNAQRPGDVVKSASGQTIEILNTDAEGRLVLADALWYTRKTYQPEWIIDLATLTGAMIVALGHEYAGYFTTSDALSEAIDKAGAATGDKVWRLPLHENYDKLIDSPIADMKNIGSRGAGSITAAQFLKRFVEDTPWMHIDVAGTVWTDKDLPLSAKGATGYGVRLLDRLISDFVEKKA